MRGETQIISFDLTEDLDLAALYAFIGESSPIPNTYSVWISLVASKDQGGVALPEWLLEVIRKTGCGVDFSFASCLGNDALVAE